MHILVIGKRVRVTLEFFGAAQIDHGFQTRLEQHHLRPNAEVVQAVRPQESTRNRAGVWASLEAAEVTNVVGSLELQDAADVWVVCDQIHGQAHVFTVAEFDQGKISRACCKTKLA
jgi:hypothetical protein